VSAAFLSKRTQPTRRPRRMRHTAKPVAEDLESRTVLAVSVTANIGGPALPVVSMNLPQPTSAEVQKVFLILKASSADVQLARDAALGKVLHDVKITLSDSADGSDTIELTDALITSFRLVPGASSDVPEIALDLEGETGHIGSISADLDGVMPRVVSVTIPQATNSDVAQPITLVVKLSAGLPKLFQDAASGRVIRQAEITLDQIGNGSTYTINLSQVFISSIEFVGGPGGEIPEAEITLLTGQGRS
jgi:type VI protein secretion system component Hcp